MDETNSEDRSYAGSLYLSVGVTLIARLSQVLGGGILLYLTLAAFDEKTFGLIALANALVAICIAISGLGLRDQFIKHLLSQMLSKKSINQARAIIYLMTVLNLIIFYTYFFLIERTVSEKQIIIFISLQLLTQIFVLDRYRLEAAEDFSFISITDLAIFLVSLFARSYLLIENIHIEFVFLIQSIELTLQNFVFSLRGSTKFETKIKTPVSAFQLFKDAFPLFMSTMMVLIYYRIDIIMISSMLNLEASGVYSAGTKVTEVFFILPMVFFTVLFPSIVRARSRKVTMVKREDMLKVFFPLLFWGSVIISIFLFLAIDDIWRLAFNGRYSGAPEVTRIHTWTLPFVVLGVLGSRVFIADGYNSLLFYRSLAGVGLNVIMNIPAIYFYGILGAALTTLITQIFTGIMFDFFFIKSRKIGFYKLSLIFVRGVGVR